MSFIFVYYHFLVLRDTIKESYYLKDLSCTRMLYTIAVILLILWLLGIVGVYTIGNFIHILLVIAIVVILIRVIQGRKPLSPLK